MNDILIEKLNLLNDDEIMLEAITTIFNQTIELERPETRDEDTDEVIGQNYRAYDKAKEILNKTMLEIKSHKITKNNIKGFNKAR